MAVAATRLGGVSQPPFDQLNLGAHVGDDPAAVAANRRKLRDACPGLEAIAWLEQVHGCAVVAADAGRVQRADAQFTTTPGLGCAVMTADCLPVLLCDREGRQVAAAHAGWRGLCAGVLEATAASFGPGAELLAWLGPAIGPEHFEVGAEVRDAFLDHTGTARPRVEGCFRPSGRPGHWLADLYALARLRLQAAASVQIYGGGLCTFSDARRFYSYRRTPATGRMACLIYLNLEAPPSA
jgi:YfiH family protein